MEGDIVEPDEGVIALPVDGVALLLPMEELTELLLLVSVVPEEAGAF